MKSVHVAPTARKDAAKNWLFTPDVQRAYNNDLDSMPLSGDKFTFTNGPYGGGRKFEIVRTMIKDDGLLVVAREL